MTPTWQTACSIEKPNNNTFSTQSKARCLCFEFENDDALVNMNHYTQDCPAKSSVPLLTVLKLFFSAGVKRATDELCSF
jgi:hypothetical protein